MSASDVFLLVVRWIHLIASAAWVGGSLFYIFVLRPALRKSPTESGRLINASVANDFRVLVDTSIFVLLATGVILTFNRLTPGVVGVPYATTLGLKIALAVWMFVLARGRRRRSELLDMYREPSSPASTRLQKALRAISGYNTILILGIVVFLLSDLLKVLFETAISQD